MTSSGWVTRLEEQSSKAVLGFGRIRRIELKHRFVRLDGHAALSARLGSLTKEAIGKWDERVDCEVTLRVRANCAPVFRLALKLHQPGIGIESIRFESRQPRQHLDFRVCFTETPVYFG